MSNFLTRILPVEEWDKLAETEFGPALKTLNPEAVSIIVCENREGQILGCWSLITFAHVEGLWIAPEHRCRGGRVLKDLWNAMCDLASGRGLSVVMTGAQTPDIAAWVERRGGLKLPFDTYVLPLKSERKAVA